MCGKTVEDIYSSKMQTTVFKWSYLGEFREKNKEFKKTQKVNFNRKENEQSNPLLKHHDHCPEPDRLACEREMQHEQITNSQLCHLPQPAHTDPTITHLW